MKLKRLLEGYAWERNADGSLPTLADAAATHAKNIQEQSLDPVVDQLNKQGFKMSTTPNQKTIKMIAHMGGGSRYISLFVEKDGSYYGIAKVGGAPEVINGFLPSPDLTPYVKRITGE